MRDYTKDSAEVQVLDISLPSSTDAIIGSHCNHWKVSLEERVSSIRLF